MRHLREASRYLRFFGTAHQHIMLSLPWWHTPVLGCLISVLLVALVVVLIRVFLIKEVHLIWIPFCLVTVFVGSIWGVSPALIATLLGFLAFNFIVIPQSDILTLDVWNDLKILGPFVLAQCGIAFIAAQNAVKHRRTLIAQRQLNVYAQELVTLNSQLEQTNEALEQANLLKEDFMTRAAHELRTPLTTILGETQLALRRLDKEKTTIAEFLVYRRHFEQIEARARGLRALIEDLIMLSSLHSGETPLRPGPCDFGKLCREVVEEQQGLSGRQIDLQVPLDPIILQADYEQLFQVTVNLVNNAIRYSLEDSVIYVCVKLEAAHVVLQVRNNGPALSHEQQARLFEPFYRTPYAELLNRKGWGLGLTLCKEIIEHHGGYIRVQSSEEQGTTFQVYIPITLVLKE